jgi:hypothetical protein
MKKLKFTDLAKIEQQRSADMAQIGENLDKKDAYNEGLKDFWEKL